MLAEPATLRLLAAERVHPIVAVRPDTQTESVAALIAAARSRDLQIGIWPLLGLDDGYWPSERNAAAWSREARRWLIELNARDCLPVWLAVDLEPPFGQTSRLLRSTYDVPIAALQLAVENMDIVRYRTAERLLRQTVEHVRMCGVKTLGVTLPLAAHDLGGDEPFWQDMFETPWQDIGWDAAGIMAYGSIVAGASRGVLDAADARALHQPLLERVAVRFGPAAHASIGITGTGVFGDEPCWENPAELGRDAAAVLAAGVHDLAIFCLEGVLHRDEPERWLRVVTRARPMVPRATWKSRSIRRGGRVVRGLGRRVFRR